MFKLVSTTAGIALAAAFIAGSPAQAQLNVQVGPGGVRIGEDRPRVERHIIERRAAPRRVIVDDDDDEICEKRSQRTRINGVWRTRTVTTCR